MYNVREVTKDIYWIGGNDRKTPMFENIHPIPEGVSYNSYLILGEKNILLDTVDWSIGREFIDNLTHLLGDETLHYLVINHMEPDHAALIEEIIRIYPDVRVIGNKKTFDFMRQFNFTVGENVIEVKDGETMSFGQHELLFVSAPMVHWPETMATFETTKGVLFSADAFGSFKSLDGKLFNDEMDFERDFLMPARRYYTNIVGKYGPQTQNLLKKTKDLDIKFICPLHGPVWRSNIEYFIDKYNKWSKYEPEEQGVMIVYGSMYGNTEAAAENLARRLVSKGMTNLVMYDASKTHVSYLISDAFKYSHIVFASATYNLNIYTPVENFLMGISSVNLRDRTVGIIVNGSWAPTAGKLIHETLDKMKGMNVLEEEVLITSTMKEEDVAQMEALANSIMNSMK